MYFLLMNHVHRAAGSSFATKERKPVYNFQSLKNQDVTYKKCKRMPGYVAAAAAALGRGGGGGGGGAVGGIALPRQLELLRLVPPRLLPLLPLGPLMRPNT